MKRLTLVALVFALFSPNTHAAEPSAAMPTTGGNVVDASPNSSASNIIGLKKFEDTNVITDAKLKADAGSLTVLSLKANFSYYGPPIDDFGKKDQPNPDSVASATKTAISGSFGARYRFDPTTTTSIGAGLKDQYPFHTGQNTTMSNPYASYDKSFRMAGIQMVASPGVTLVTEEVYRNLGERWGVNAKLNGVRNIGDSKFAVGSDNTIAYYFFDRDYKRDIPAVGKKKAIRGDGAVQRISITFAPNVKYNITRNLAAITSWGFTFYNPRSEDSRFEYRTRLVNQRLGMGWAITRDVYINPYVQFYPTQFSWSTATANITTSFSIL